MASKKKSNKGNMCGMCGEDMGHWPSKHQCGVPNMTIDGDISDMHLDEQVPMTAQEIADIAIDEVWDIAHAEYADWIKAKHDADSTMGLTKADKKRKRNKDRKSQYTCEYCGKPCTNASGLSSHVRAKHKAEMVDIDVLIAQLSERVGYITKTSEEAHVQAEKDNARYHKVSGLADAITMMEDAIDSYANGTMPTLLDQQFVADERKEILVNRKLLATLQMDVSYQRGKEASTIMERNARINENEREAIRLNKLNDSSATAWTDTHTLRYYSYITGSTWVPSSHPKWAKHGGMPFILDMCWYLNAELKKFGVTKNPGKIMESGILPEAIPFFLKRYKFERTHRELVNIKKWRVDDDGLLCNDPDDMVYKEVLPFDKWVDELTNIYLDYIGNFWRNGEDDWAQKKGVWGSCNSIESIHLPERGARIVKLSDSISLEDQEKLRRLEAQSDDPVGEEIRR